jgi:uridylate kinase
MKQEYIVISLGGSLIYKDDLDVNFIKEFVSFIKNYLENGYKFIIITGGGKLCRKYDQAVLSIDSSNIEDLDKIGINATRLNAELLRVLFAPFSNKEIIINPEEVLNLNDKVIVGGGWKPGSSSDLVAVLCASKIEAKKLINLSNIDFVYDKNPKENADAKPLKEISWNYFRNLIPSDWDPGLNSPFDPIASKEAERLGLEVVIMNGEKLDNLKNYLDGKEFIGTIIK